MQPKYRCGRSALVIPDAAPVALGLADEGGLRLDLLRDRVRPFEVERAIVGAAEDADALFHRLHAVGILHLHEVLADECGIAAMGKRLALHVEAIDIKVAIDITAISSAEIGVGFLGADLVDMTNRLVEE